MEMAHDDVNSTGLPGKVTPQFYQVRPSIDPTTVRFGLLGYAEVALESFEIFRKLSSEGVISPNTRFQVSLPTPVALLSYFVVPEQRLVLETAIETAMLKEVEQIQKAIPAQQLALQWDATFEVLGAAGGPQLPYPDAIEGSLRRLGHLNSFVKPEVQLGIHLCYGDLGHKHIVEPVDLAIAVAFANGFSETGRRIDFIHMPVPANRRDDTYFRPLADWKLPACTRLILGLIHYSDGLEGSRRRIEVATRHAQEFDLSTECGFGRRDPSTIPALLEIHRKLAANEN